MMIGKSTPLHLRPLTLLALSSLLLGAGAAPPATFTDLATPFEKVAATTAGQPEAARVAAERARLNALLPGVYPEGDATDRRLAKTLAELAQPARQARYEQAIHLFPAALATATARFRRVFPRFASPFPIYLYHSLGERDGGTDYLEPGHRHVMLFGADMIVALHADSSLQPFLDHELFHLQHATAFADCDQFWCVLWQEGLAVNAAATMTPGATDHQLTLDVPAPIRAPTDARWPVALCYAAENFDSTEGNAVANALQSGTQPPRGLPVRFGYYLGYRLSLATGRNIAALAPLDNEHARVLLRATLARLISKARAPCAPPAARAEISHRAPHAV